MKRGIRNTTLATGMIAISLWACACGGLDSVLNPTFVNTIAGGGFPLTPGPVAPFILVRVVNETRATARFIVTVEHLEFIEDDDGNRLFEANGLPVTRAVLETKPLATFPGARVNEIGVLFECSETPITRIGLGDNLEPGEAAVFVGGTGPVATGGLGIRPTNLNPLSLEAGNFNCGDTVIFQAFENNRVAGGVDVQVFLLPGSEQPSEFRSPSTFGNYWSVLQANRPAAEGP